MCCEPLLALAIVGHGSSDSRPERIAVMGLVQMDKLVDDEVVDDARGQ